MNNLNRFIFRFSLLVTIFFTVSCNLHFFYKEPVRNLSDMSSKPRIDKSKIALVGFYDFYTEYKRYGKIESYPYTVSYYTRFLDHFDKIGTPADDIKSEGNTNITQNGKDFVQEYLKFTGPTGMREMENIFVFENEIPVALKLRNIEYFIVGSFAPQVSINKRNHYMGGIGQLLTTLVNFVSLGLIPMWQDYYTENRIQVYDKNFNLVFDKSITKNTHFLATWWLTPNDLDTKKGSEGRNDRSKMISKHARKIIYGADLQDLAVDFMEWQASQVK